MNDNHSLRNYFLLPVVAAIVPLVALVAYLFYGHAQDRAVQARSSAFSLAKSIALHLSEEVGQIRQFLAYQASDSRIRRLDPALVPEELARFADEFSRIGNLFLVDAQGKVLDAGQSVSPSILNLNAESDWLESLSRGRFFAVEPIFGLSGTILTGIVFAQALQNEQEEFDGALCAYVDWAEYQSSLSRLSLPAGYILTLLDERGILIYRSQASEQWVGRSVQEHELAVRIQQDREGERTGVGFDGQKESIGFASIPTVDWAVLVSVPSRLIRVSARSDILKTSLLLLAAVVMAMLLAMLLSNRVCRPIRQLVAALQTSAEGSEAALIPIDGPRELAEVARVFNRLAIQRRKTETSLHKAEEKFRLLTEKSHTGVYIFQDDRFVYVNPKMEEIFNLSREELQRLSPIELVVPEDVVRVRQHIQDRLEGRQTTVHYTCALKSPIGKRFEVEVYGQRIDYEERPALMGSLVDITARRAMEAALRKSEEEYRLLADTCTDMISRVSQDGILRYVSPSCQSLLGFYPEHLVGVQEGDFVHPEDIDGVWKTIHEQAAKGDSYRSEYRMRRKDGSYAWVETNGRLIKDLQTSEIREMLCFTRDVTERKLAEEALQQSEEKYRTLIEQSPDGVFLMDLEGRFLETNCAGCQMSGFAREEFIGKNVRELMVPEEVARMEPTLAAIIAGKIVSSEWKCRHRDGSRFPGEFRARLLPEGRILGILRNISEQKLAESAIRALQLKYQALVEQIPAIVYTTDPQRQGPMPFVSPQIQSLGFPVYVWKEQPGLFWQQVYPRDVPRIQAALDGMQQTGKPFHCEYRIQNQEGKITWFQDTAAVIEHRNGEPSLVQGILVDITEQKQADAERSRLADIVEATPDFVGTATLDGQLVYLNRSFRQIIGIQEDEGLLGNPISRFHPPNSNKILQEKAFPTAVKEGRWSGEVAWLTRDGVEVPALAVMVAHQGEDDSIDYLSIVGHDIRRLKAAEQSLREVSQRLLRMQEEVQRRIARELHDTTGQNLVALSMHLQRLKTSLDQASPASLRPLEDAIALANQCTQELRTFSYLLHPPVLEDLGFEEALRDYALGFEQRSGIQVECDLAPGLQSPPKDVAMTLFRVVQEGLLNIHRHSGSPTAAIRLWQEEAETWLEIADQGKGIPPDKLELFKNPATHLSVGIPSMRERIRGLGGRLELRAGKHGVTLQVIVPLTRADRLA